MSSIPAVPASLPALSKRVSLAAIASRLIGIVLLLWAAFFFASAVCAIVNFAWHYPMFDQWHMYPALLNAPFPQNVLLLESGHRPVIPNVIRHVEVEWFGASQVLQIFIGVTCAALVSLTIAITAWRDRQTSFLGKCAVAMLGFIGIFWLANSRMLMHGSEALHVYLLLLLVCCAALGIYSAGSKHTNGGLVAASFACVCAMFCFGPGVASFPAVLIVGAIMGIGWRRLLIPAVAFVAALTVYLFVLPGDDSVRHMLRLDPWGSVDMAMKWISSCWAYAWLGYADPPLFPDFAATIAARHVTSLLPLSANAVVAALHVPWRTLCTIVGLSAVTAFVVRGVWKLRAPMTRLQCIATTLCLFTLFSAAVVGISRLDSFQTFQDQVFADRYMPWSCVFWMALTILVVSDVFTPQRRIRTQFLLGIGLCTVPMILLPMHKHYTGWSAAVYSASEKMAASAKSLVSDASVFPTGDGADFDTTVRTLAMFRKRHLAMYAEPNAELIDTPWTAGVEPDNEIASDVQVASTFDDPLSQIHVGRLTGTVRHGIGHIDRYSQIAVLDDQRRIVGFAEFTSLSTDGRVPLLSMPRKRGFDGYVRNYDPEKVYEVVLLQPGRSQATHLATLQKS